ncbi:MAG: inositol phosphorylceramide synthase [Thermomicrobiaceae bacterium]|nr:inositol phosphorylceramide synthase [Thermomicrobiaceae bacterium]
MYPLLFAFLLWIGNKERFWHFSLTLLMMTYVGFVFYLLYPAAPPWMANDWGNIHGLQIPFNQVWQALAPKQYHDLDQFQIWSMVSGNPVAAMPSLHAAYPWLTMLFAVKFFGKKGLLFGIYNLALWFAVLYLGQHWAIDILAGIALANAAFLVMTVAWPRIRKMANSTVRIPRPSWPGALSGRLRPAVSRQRADEQSSYLD